MDLPNMRRASLDLTDPSRNIEESVGSPSADTADALLDLSLPLAEDGMMEAQDDAGGGANRIFTPPPHIAARFHRPAQSRRKDSGASSRRSSVSSMHSRSSHSFGIAEGPQSKYVAQHLRRASILEDRKARLADRAANAEKVRLRAALAKAATRDTSASEERALAAAQAREKNLAEIAAACAEEVKRAKAVAESIKEKRENEVRKMRLQMEERMAEAERRREEMRVRNAAKSRARGQSIAASSRQPVGGALPEVAEVKEREEAPPMRQDVAVAKIQLWWRANQRRTAVAELLQLGLTIDGVRETSFEKVVELLAQEKVLLATSRVLRICGLKEGEVGSVGEMAAVRTFLSAFMILGHPAQVLSNKNDKEKLGQVGAAQTQPIAKDDLANPQLQELVGKAKDLLISFEEVLSCLTSSNNYTPPPALIGPLNEVYAAFHNAFIGWKARDSSALIDVMLMQFVELDAIWQTVKDSTDPSVTESYRQSIQENQVMLIVRIKKLAGQEQGKKLVFDAVRKARKARAEKKPAGDAKPREVEHTVETAMGDLGSVPASRGQQPTPPATPTGGRRQLIAQIPVPRFSLLPDNRIVVHELAINNEYRMKADEFNEQQAKFLRPLFDQMRATMQGDASGEHFYLLIKVAESIRESLQHLVKPGSSMFAFIGEMLDTEVAERQFATGNFSYEKFFAAMGSLLPKLCAPIRDDEVKDVIENRLSRGHYVDRLEALMCFINVMRSDYANYLLTLAAPGLIESASQYEAKRFAADLEGFTVPTVALGASEAAWRAARSKVLAEAARRDPEGVNHPRSRPGPDRFYSQMLVDLFTQTSPVPFVQIPEMLRLDHRRILRTGELSRRIVTTGAILLQCKNLLKRDVRAPWRTEAGRIMSVLEAEHANGETTVEGIMAALEAGRSMPAPTKAQLRGLVTKIVAASAECALRGADGAALEPREAVLRLLLYRLRANVLARLTAASASEKVRATSMAGEKLASAGLAEFVERIRDMVNEIGKVGSVDREAHGLWWEEVARKVVRDEDEAAAAVGAAVAAPVAGSSSA